MIDHNGRNRGNLVYIILTQICNEQQRVILVMENIKYYNYCTMNIKNINSVYVQRHKQKIETNNKNTYNLRRISV